MGRKAKAGLDYFPFDIDFFSDMKVRKLIRYQGGKAVTVYALLLCTIYKDGYYMRWDKELPFIISEQTGYDEVYILEAVNCCLNIGLFSKDLYDREGVLTSKGIQERYRLICRSCRRNGRIGEYNLVDVSEEKPISSEEITVSSEEKAINSAKSTQSKLNKRKENNTACYLAREDFLKKFLHDNPDKGALGRTVMAMGLSIDEFAMLAREVVDEWAATGKEHPKGFSDAASNLIAAVRRKKGGGGFPGAASARLMEERARKEREAERREREESMAKSAANRTTWREYAKSRGIDPEKVSAAEYARNGGIENQTDNKQKQQEKT